MIQGERKISDCRKNIGVKFAIANLKVVFRLTNYNFDI